MKIAYQAPCWIIECDRGLFRINPPHVHNFRTSRPVLRLEGERRIPKQVGTVISGPDPKTDPESYAKQVIEADADWEAWLRNQPLGVQMNNQTWVLDLDAPTAI